MSEADLAVRTGVKSKEVRGWWRVKVTCRATRVATISTGGRRSTASYHL